jgi:hypothetical protein
MTTDETWVHYFMHETKRSSMQWRHPESPKPKKAKTTFSVGKVMATINAEYYSALLEGPVKATIRNKRKRAQTSVSFLQDNVHPHVAARTMDTIQKLKCNVLPHPPYRPDRAAASDCHLFDPLKELLGGKRLRNDEEVTQAVREWLHWQPKDFFLSFRTAGAGVSQTGEIMLESNTYVEK